MHSTQKSRHLTLQLKEKEAWVLLHLTALWHPHGAGFRHEQNVRVVQSGRLPPKFQKKKYRRTSSVKLSAQWRPKMLEKSGLEIMDQLTNTTRNEWSQPKRGHERYNHKPWLSRWRRSSLEFTYHHKWLALGSQHGHMESNVYSDGLHFPLVLSLFLLLLLHFWMGMFILCCCMFTLFYCIFYV